MFDVGHDIIKTISGARRRDTEKRINYVFRIFLTGFAIFGIFTLYLGMQEPNRVRPGGAGSGHWTTMRGPIVDRRGEILAQNVMVGYIQICPRHVQDTEAASRTLNSILPHISIDAARRVLASNRSCTYIHRFATAAEFAAAQNVRHPAGATRWINAVEQESRRYPKRRLFSHIVGFVGADMQGQEGVERTSNRFLLDNTDPLVLSLDARVQTIMYQELLRAKQTFRAIGAIGILMNARNGEIISIVSLPDFDPEDRSGFTNVMFMPTRGTFEMGSVFKTFTAAMAAENGIPLTQEFRVDRPYQIRDRHGRPATRHPINDHEALRRQQFTYLSVAGMLHHSSNIAAAQIALEMPAGAMTEFFQRLHFDRPLDLDFGRTERPGWHRTWGPVERATAAFGHGMTVTPMHKILAFNAMVNGGIYIWPTVYRARPPRGERVISPELSQDIRVILHGITETGSGARARIQGINTGGKTSTAQKRRPDGSPDPRRVITSFAVTFPIESPMYTMLVMLDEPQGTAETFNLRTSAWNAVPTAGRIMDGIFPILFSE